MIIDFWQFNEICQIQNFKFQLNIDGTMRENISKRISHASIRSVFANDMKNYERQCTKHPMYFPENRHGLMYDTSKDNLYIRYRKSILNNYFK